MSDAGDSPGFLSLWNSMAYLSNPTSQWNISQQWWLLLDIQKFIEFVLIRWKITIFGKFNNFIYIFGNIIEPRLWLIWLIHFFVIFTADICLSNFASFDIIINFILYFFKKTTVRPVHPRLDEPHMPYISDTKQNLLDGLFWLEVSS